MYIKRHSVTLNIPRITYLMQLLRDMVILHHHVILFNSFPPPFFSLLEKGEIGHDSSNCSFINATITGQLLLVT